MNRISTSGQRAVSSGPSRVRVLDRRPLAAAYPLMCCLLALALLAPIPAIAENAPSARPAPAARPLPPGVRLVADVKYGDAPGVANLLDVYLPATPDADSAPLRPLIVYIHGGGWEQGDKQGCPAQRFVPRGYVVASINYRLSKEAIFPAQIEDCKGALRFLRAHAKDYHLDPARVGVWGSSAGGHLVALLGTTNGLKELEGTVGGNLDQSSAVQCVCDFFGPTDFVQFVAQAAAGGHPVRDPGNSALSRLLGGTIEAKKDLALLASPITHVSKDSAPILILHGDKDPLVPLAQSQTFCESLKTAGVDATLDVIANNGHGGAGFGSKEETEKLVAFFDKYLKPTADGAAPGR